MTMATKTKAPGSLPIDQVAAQVVAECRSDKLCEARIRSMAAIVATLKGKCDVQRAADLERGDIHDRFDAANAHYAESTRRRLRLTFHALLRRAHKRGLIGKPDLPTVSHYQPYERRSTPLPVDDIERLGRHLATTLKTWQDHRRFALASACVLGKQNVGRWLRLRTEDLKEMGAGKVRLIGQLHKGSRLPSDFVPIPVKLGEILEESTRHTKCDWVFPNAARTGPWFEGTKEMPILARRALQRAARDAGIERWSEMTFESLARFGREFPDRAAEWPYTRPGPATSSETPLPVIRLDGPGDPVFVDGRRERALDVYEHRVINALLDAGPDGLGFEEMSDRCGRGGWRKTFTRLASDPVWAPMLRAPKSARNRYRLLAIREAA